MGEWTASADDQPEPDRSERKDDEEDFYGATEDKVCELGPLVHGLIAREGEQV